MYKFNEAKHLHSWNDKPLHGVTTVLGVIAKPALIGWAANMAVDFLETVYKVDGQISDAFFKEARTAHRRKKEEAGTKGTDVHATIEEIIKDAIKNNLGFVKGEGALHPEKQIQNFTEWATQNKVKFLESEKHVWSESAWLGGILDAILIKDGKKYMADFKTSSGIYPEFFAQMGAYHLCLDDMGEHKDIAGYIILNLKKDGKMNVGISEDMQFNKEYFTSILQTYKLKQKADESITKK